MRQRSDRGTPGRTRTVKVGPVDVLNATNYCAFVIGPIAAGDEVALLATLRGIAARGPAARIQLIPRTDSRRWELREEIDGSYLGPGPDGKNIGESLAGAIGGTYERSICVGVRDDYLLFAFDHGVGDGRMCGEVVAALSAASERHDLRRAIDGLDGGPQLANVVLSNLRDRPRALLGALISAVRAISRERIESRRRPAGPRLEGGLSTVATELSDLDVVFVAGPDGAIASIDSARRSLTPSVSRGAVIAHHLYRGFAAAGLTMSPEIQVLVDLRDRRRQASRPSMANVFAVVGVPCSSELELADFNVCYHEAVRQEAALARLLMSLAVRYPQKRLGGGNRAKVRPARADAAATMTISDLTGSASLNELRWLEDDPRPAINGVASAPGSTRHLEVAVTAARGAVCFTVTYSTTGFARSAVEAGVHNAMQSLTDWSARAQL